MKVRTAALLAWRMLVARPRRTVLLLVGYGLGVAVMVALLAVGDALLLQAQDKDVVSGGDVVLLPQGIDPEVLKVGGVTGMFLAIPNARYVVRQVLLGPRFEDRIVGVSPEVTDKLVYVRVGGRITAALATASIPSLARAAGSAVAVASLAWTDTAEDRAWAVPPPAAWLEEIDRFHRPGGDARGRTWAEWWYFNFSAPSGLYGYVTFSTDQAQHATVQVSVRLPRGGWIRWQEQGRAKALPFAESRFQVGSQSAVLNQGIYTVHLARGNFMTDLQLHPISGLDFPPIERQVGTFRSGYVVPVLRAAVHGVVRMGADQARVTGIGYHDHNWGVWQDVTWEWGTASNDGYALLAGLIHHPALRGQTMFVSVYAVDQGRPGLVATFQAAPPKFERWHRARRLDGVPLTVPGRIRYQASNNAGDQLTVLFTVDDVLATPLREHSFLQLRGRYRLDGRMGGRLIRTEMVGWAETFVAAP